MSPVFPPSPFCLLLPMRVRGFLIDFDCCLYGPEPRGGGGGVCVGGVGGAVGSSQGRNPPGRPPGCAAPGAVTSALPAAGSPPVYLPDSDTLPSRRVLPPQSPPARLRVPQLDCRKPPRVSLVQAETRALMSPERGGAAPATPRPSSRLGRPAVG